MREHMESPEGWGRAQGREVYQKLLAVVEANPGVLVFKLSMKGVKRLDISFASEAIVEIARRYRGSKGFCLIDLADPDMIENCDAGAARKSQPILVWSKGDPQLIGAKPSEGNRDAFEFVLRRGRARAAEFTDFAGMSITNASTKFKQLWEQGFFLRQDTASETGGVEFVYKRIG
jgi:hypothetical protein